MLEKNDEYWMREALQAADCAQKQQEIPVGAVVVKDGELIARGWNLSITDHDPSAHAEMMAIREAGKVLQNYRLVDCTLYVTLEPCPMCAGLLVHSRISRLVFGAADYKTGAAGSVMNLLQHEKLNHQIDVLGGVLEAECAGKISQFFKLRRAEIKALKKIKNSHLSS